MPSCSAEDERPLLPLSYLSQYGYCPRRCGLLLLEQVWADNEYTAAGAVQHERVHTQRVEHRGDTMKLYELPVWSHRLGLSGKCDCIEAVPDAAGVPLPFGAGNWALYPVEYKHGVVRAEREYELQLCAQAMCLEERYGCTIPEGALFYQNAHRRLPVALTAELRRAVEDTCGALAALWQAGRVPDAIYSAKCRKCSLAEHCQPKLARSAQAYCQALWDAAKEDAE